MKQNKGVYIRMADELLEKATEHAKKKREPSGVSGLIRRLLSKEVGFKEKE